MLHDGTRCCCIYLWQLQTCAIAMWHQYVHGQRDQLWQIPNRVRAGVRDVEKAQGYIDTAVAYGLLPRDAARKIALVEYDITDPDTIPSAIGNAAKVRLRMLQLATLRLYDKVTCCASSKPLPWSPEPPTCGCLSNSRGA